MALRVPAPPAPVVGSGRQVIVQPRSPRGTRLARPVFHLGTACVCPLSKAGQNGAIVEDAIWNQIGFQKPFHEAQF